jgi:hypothetical protein
MNLQQFGELIKELVNDPTVKKIEIIGWSEPKLMEDKPMPIMKITKYKKTKG